MIEMSAASDEFDVKLCSRETKRSNYLSLEALDAKNLYRQGTMHTGKYPRFAAVKVKACVASSFSLSKPLSKSRTNSAISSRLLLSSLSPVPPI